MTQSAPNTKALTSRGGGWLGWGCPAPWQAPAANGMALEEARAASGASKTCEEGRGYRESLSCCHGPQPHRHHCPPPASMSSAHFNRGPAYGLSAEVKNKVGLECLPWPGPYALPDQRPCSWGSLETLLPIPCDMELKRKEGQVCRRGCLPLPPEHPRALSFGWVVEWGTYRQPRVNRGSCSIAKTPLDQNPLLTLCFHGSLGEDLLTFPTPSA